MSDDNVVAFPGAGEEDWVELQTVSETDQICSADDVIEAQLGKLSNVVLCGVDENGELVLASSFRRVADAHYMVAKIQHKLRDFGF